ncbi:hypothetical protein [Aurantimonas marina]|nr:hypothetical protein [Aurantimonas marina]
MKSTASSVEQVAISPAGRQGAIAARNIHAAIHDRLRYSRLI